MKNNFSINIGDRITYNDENYEICHIENDVIRYSNLVSGNMYFITYDDLTNKIICEDIKFTTLSIPKLHTNQALTINEISIYLKYFFQTTFLAQKEV